MIKVTKGAIISLTFISVFAFAQGQVEVIYAAPQSPAERALKQQIKASAIMETTVRLINAQFIIPHPLFIVMGGEDGPLYDPAENQIFIPYFFVQQVHHRFEQANYGETGVTPHEATEDALMHTVFHEFAHAAIAMYDIPVLGKEEDAADALANVLLIEYFEQGQEIALSAADLFDLESDDREVLEDEDFSAEHSLDDQRYFSLLCHIYGSDPDEYAHIVEQGQLSAERGDMCIDEYDNISHSWITLLAPYIKQEQKE